MAKALKKTLQQAQKMGRGRDTILAHITPEEAKLLKSRGGRGSRNPQTGLLEFEEDGEELEGESDYSYSGNATETYDPTKEYTDLGESEDYNAPAESVTYPVRNNDNGGSDSGDNQQQVVVANPTPAPVSIQDQIRNELKGWGGTTEQIDAILNRLVMGERKPTSGDPNDDPYGPGTSNEDLTTILNQLKEVPEEDRIVYLIDNFGGDVVEEWGGAGGTQAIPLNDATRASELQKSQEQRLQEAVDRQVLGSSTGEGLEDNGDGSFTDLDTNITYYRGDDGKLTDRDGNVRYDPGTGLAARIEADQGRADTLANTLYGPGEDSITSQLQTQANDYNTFVSDTVDSLDDPENDFASQVGSALQGFLDGANGQKGFLDYQQELLGAGQTLKTDMQGLQATYDRLYSDYGSELRPLTDEMAGATSKLGDVADASMGVAKDAGDKNYYTRLKNLLYADAQDQIDRSTRDATGNLQQMYANSGMDTSSPAYTAAMMDLQKSRSDAQRSSYRQAILDSYGLGSQMLTNRSTALGNAGNAYSNQISGIGSQMNALDSLYGVQLQGLNNRKDMIGQIYNVDKNNATVGMQGLNTVLNTKLHGINTSADQFYKHIGLTNDLYRSNMDVTSGLGNAIGSGLNYYSGQADKNFNTLLEANQGAKSDAFSFAKMENWFQENNQEMPDFLEQYRPSSR